MTTPNYPSSGDLIVTFLDNVRRYRVNSVRGVNPTLINVGGELMYIYIKNLSPAQLSNDNPDIWRIQLPKRKEFDEIKSSNQLFLLFGYDYVRKVYTTWNPYWCKQRLNVAESCSMYSRLSLQKRVAATQKIEKMQLQNDGDVLCIPASLIASYLKNIKDYYPEDSKYVPVGSSIQKRAQAESKEDIVEQKTCAEILFDKFWGCYRASEYRSFLQDKGFKRNIVSNYVTRIDYVLDKGFIEKHKDIFFECTNLKEYKRAINRFCWQPDVRYYEDMWHNEISASLKQYLMYVEKKLFGTQNIRIKSTVEDEFNTGSSKTNEKEKSPLYVLDDFGKLIALDPVIVDRLVPKVRGVDFPDYVYIIKEIKEYYPPQATEKMTPADWFKLFDSTKWRKIRGRKAQTDIIPHEPSDTSIVEETSKHEDETVAKDNLVEPEEITLDYNTLKMVFDKKVTSYKYFWFFAIITIAKEKGTLSLSFDDIVIRMASIAWPIVIEDGIDLGERDMLAKILRDIQKKTYLISAASSRVVESSLYDYYRIMGINKMLAPLLANVPYRFLTPWVKFISNEDTIASSNEDNYYGLYSINPNGIVINSKWWEYIESHYHEICDFAIQSFISYAKQYNNDLKMLRLMTDRWKLVKNM